MKISQKEYDDMMLELSRHSRNAGILMAQDLLEEFAMRGELEIFEEASK